MRTKRLVCGMKSTTSSTPKRDYIRLSLLQLFFHYAARLVVMIYDLLLVSFLGEHGRSVIVIASVAYPFYLGGIRAILSSFWSRSLIYRWYVVVVDQIYYCVHDLIRSIGNKGLERCTTRKPPCCYVVVVMPVKSVSTSEHNDAFWHDFDNESNWHAVWHNSMLVDV